MPVSSSLAGDHNRMGAEKLSNGQSRFEGPHPVAVVDAVRQMKNVVF